MKENLRKLYNENSLTIEENMLEVSEKNRLLEDLDNCHHGIECKLDDEGKALLMRFERLQGEILINESEAAFIRGFSLATKLMSEALT